MKERANKDKLKAAATLSKSKRSKKKGSSGDGASASSTTPITSFFSSRPPPQLACPLCGHMVPRLKINEHIDFQCQNFERSVSASPDVTGEQDARRSPEMGQTQDGLKERTSPYFKKSHFKKESEEKSVVRVLELGSLSARLSRKRHKIPETAQKVEQHHEKELSSEGLDSSQKENLLQRFEGADNCVTAPEIQPGSETAQNLHHKASGWEEPDQNPSSSTLVKGKMVFSSNTVGCPKRAKCDGQKQPHAKEPSSIPTSGCSGSGGDAEEASEDAPQACGAESSPPDQEVRFSQPSRLPYYLQNFRSVLGAVLENEDDRALFDRHDMSHVRAFEKLSGMPTRCSSMLDLGGTGSKRLLLGLFSSKVTAQKLYVRLFQRKLKWLQVSKLDYEEICRDLQPVVQELVDGGFLQSGEKKRCI